MKKNRKILGVALVLSLVALLLPATIFAADTGEVICTVSGKLISVSVTDGDVAYGTLATSATQDTTASGVDDTQTATNDGTVAEDFKIKSSNAIRDGGTDWTLGWPAKEDVFTHEYTTAGGLPWTHMTDAGIYYDLADDIDPGASQDFDLRVGMPTSITDYQEHTITVTVLAVEAA